MATTPTLRLVAANAAMWAEFQTFFEVQVPVPKRAIFVAVDHGGGEVLAAGVCVVDTDGPYILFEHFGTNQALPLAVRHAAAVAVANAIKGTITVSAKLALLLVGPKGAAKMLADRGARVADGVVVMHWLPPIAGDTVPMAPGPPQAAPTRAASPKTRQRRDESDEDFFERIAADAETENPA